VDEKRMLMARREVDEFAGALARLRDALERLEKRVERLG
jgi:ubiquinone biosynthesis protein UbiJ